MQAFVSTFIAAVATGPVAAESALTAAEVGQIIAQAVNEAQGRGALATIAAVDRVGNVLGVFQMTGAAANATISSGRNVVGGLEAAAVPSTLAAIAKAITGAYISSRGNAFTTRTASQIVQQNFNVGETFQPGGPLFGVQFSQLPCSDLAVRFFDGGAGGIVNATLGPKRSPLGLSADPGGLPLYKAGDLVGGIGVISDSLYSLDPVITNFDTDADELIAVGGQSGFAPPNDIKANFISAGGRTLRYIDRGPEALARNPATATAFGGINGVVGVLANVTGYFTAGGGILAGRQYGTAASGYRLEDGTTYGTFRNGNRAMILVDGADTNRFPPAVGSDGLLSAAEVTRIMIGALAVAYAGRAQIRRPLSDNIHVTISIVDTNGKILALARTFDGPVFGTDVSLQKARSAMFFSNLNAAADFTAGGHGARVAQVRTFFGIPTLLADGIAWGNRSIGNIARPYYPDGINGNPNGPLSNPESAWSPFSVGLQLELVSANILTHLGFVAGLNADTPSRCTALPLQVATGAPRLANGLQIFAGGVPIFRGNTQVGGIGISGDGIDQDDMVAFLGLHNAGVALATGVSNAPKGIRADNISAFGARLRYVNCPFAPFIDTSAQNVCAGK
ncbi:MAG: hypothetical protein EXQ91_00680 [Alphaproteobacteria bacterium]|nr:hypothetical protein [Alphaproteobacteria bacterium]